MAAPEQEMLRQTQLELKGIQSQIDPLVKQQQKLLELSGNAVKSVEAFGADAWHVSITHDAGVAVAVVILERTGEKKS